MNLNKPNFVRNWRSVCNIALPATLYLSTLNNINYLCFLLISIIQLDFFKMGGIDLL